MLRLDVDREIEPAVGEKFLPESIEWNVTFAWRSQSLHSFALQDELDGSSQSGVHVYVAQMRRRLGLLH